MAQARTQVAGRKRTREVFRWLRRVFPPPKDAPVKLVLHDSLPEDFGYVDWEAEPLELHLNLAYPQEVVNSTLVHEWAHVLDDRDDARWLESMTHDATFDLIHGRVYRRFYEEGGVEESKWIKSR